MTQSAANVHDSIEFAGLLAAIPAIKQPYGYRRKRPDKADADKAYDFPRCRQFLRQRHITQLLARRGVESSEQLGKHRWVLERTLAWRSR